MATYRRITEKVDVFLYDGTLPAVKKFMDIDDAQYDTDSRELMLPSKAGQSIRLVAAPGDYIIKDSQGTFVPYKPENFKKLFERVEEVVEWDGDYKTLKAMLPADQPKDFNKSKGLITFSTPDGDLLAEKGDIIKIDKEGHISVTRNVSPKKQK